MTVRPQQRHGPNQEAWIGVLLILVGSLFVVGIPAAAHEVRPAYWEIEETEPGVFAVLWKQPVFADQEPGIARRLPVDPVMPAECSITENGLPTRTTGAIVRRFDARCPAGLTGLELRVEGLQRTLMDVLLRIELHPQSTGPDAELSHSVLLKPGTSTYLVGAGHSASVPTYLKLGVEHMLEGIDHLLFVLGLVLLSRGAWQVVKLITAFTIAHSITLGLTALDYVSLPQGPVEAVIALSILFLAVEILQPEDQRTVLARNSWTVAFGFGLLHGCGFAGALAEIGLPQSAKLPALFLFNVGVELGQLLAVASFLAVIALGKFALQRLTPDALAQTARFAVGTAAFVIGTTSAFWFIQRTLGLFS